MIVIILNEWKILVRNRSIVYVSLIFILSIISLAWMSNVQSENQSKAQAAAEKHIRSQWDNLEPMNPHRAAHYGVYVFKPVSILNSLDDGVSSITGNVLKLEGHVQNEIVHSEASQSITISKFGKLKPSIILQYVVPLFLIFLSFGSINNDKETGIMKLIALQGVSPEKLVLSKSISIWLYGLMLIMSSVLLQSLFGSLALDVGLRLGLTFISYGLYYLIVVFLSTFISVSFRNNTSAISLLLATWIVWTIFLPKIWGNTVEKVHPLPSRQNFIAQMKEDRSKGIDGHNPRDERRSRLEKEYLIKYKVDSLSQLPINFDGIVMQADEEYGNQVWDKHFGNNYLIYQKQKKLYQLSGLLNPFSSLQNLSMGFCGSDMIHHLDFLKKAENYRRYLIKTLNDKHAHGGSRTGEWRWTVDNTFFRSVKTFDYQTMMIKNHIGNYLFDILALIAWAIFAGSLMRYKIKRDILL